MVAPRSTNALGKEHSFICTVAIRFPRSSYFAGVSLPHNKSNKVPTTWTIGVVFIFLLGFLVHNSLIVFA